MLGWELRVVTRLCKVLNPSLMLNRLFCSAEMWVILLVSVCCRQQIWTQGQPRNDIFSVFHVISKSHACKLKSTKPPTLLDSIFPCPEKPNCGDSGLEALSKGLGGDMWPGCAGKWTKKDNNKESVPFLDNIWVFWCHSSEHKGQSNHTTLVCVIQLTGWEFLRFGNTEGRGGVCGAVGEMRRDRRAPRGAGVGSAVARRSAASVRRRQPRGPPRSGLQLWGNPSNTSDPARLLNRT